VPAWCKRRSVAARGFPAARLWAVLLLLFGHGFSLASDLTPVPIRSLPRSVDKRLQDYVAAHPGQPLLINFWASWCEPCREEMPSLHRLAQRWHDRGLAVVTVAVADGPKRVEAFLAEISVDLPVIDDRDQLISRSWDARVLPSTFILDRRHRVRLRGTGPIDWDSPAVDRQLNPLLR
jgi:thiol-disulfide isomerase/thioredoxin